MNTVTTGKGRQCNSIEEENSEPTLKKQRGDDDDQSRSDASVEKSKPPQEDPVTADHVSDDDYDSGLDLDNAREKMATGTVGKTRQYCYAESSESSLKKERCDNDVKSSCVPVEDSISHRKIVKADSASEVKVDNLHCSEVVKDDSPCGDKHDNESASEYGLHEDIQPSPMKQPFQTSKVMPVPKYKFHWTQDDQTRFAAALRERRKSARRIYPEEYDSDDSQPETDFELLCMDSPDWFEVDGARHLGFFGSHYCCKNNKPEPEVYKIVTNGFCEESEFRRVLSEIGCDDRFLACSIERARVFFAKLTKDEAEKLKGVEGLFEVANIKRRR